MLESLKVINEPLRSFATVLVECCAYAGTGNVLKVQHMLHICSEHFEHKDEKKVMKRLGAVRRRHEKYSIRIFQEGEKETSKDKDKDKKKDEEAAAQNAAHQGKRDYGRR